MDRLKYEQILRAIGFVILLFPLTLFQFFSTDIIIGKAIFIACIGISGLIFSIIHKAAIKINSGLLLLPMLLYLWQFVKGTPLNELGIVTLLCCLFLFIELSNRNKILLFAKVLPSIIIVLLAIEIVFFLYPLPNANNFFAPNNSIFSILIAAQISFVLPALHYFVIRKTSVPYILIFLLTALSFLLLFKTGGRSGMLALAVSACIYICVKYSVQQKLLKIGAVFLIVIVFASLFFYKINSSNGRLMIYTVILKEVAPTEWVTGIGFGQFKVKYNQWQASYFAENPSYNSDVPYAENIYYAFNDPLQLIVELGIGGLLVLLFCGYHFLKKFKHDIKEKKVNNPILLGGYLCIVSLGISSLFLYPFQVVCMYPLLIIALAVINANQVNIEQENNRVNLKLPYFIRILFFFAFIFTAINIFMFRNKLEAAKELSRSSFRTKAIENYRVLNNGIVWDKSLYLSYAAELQKVKKLDSAIIFLTKSAKYIYTDHTSKLFAKIYFEKGMFNIAEEYYKQSVYINPKSYKNRFVLMNFYLETNQRERAKKVGEFILSMPYKMSERINVQIRRQTQSLLQNLQ